MASGTAAHQQTRWRTPCQQCPLRGLDTFRDFSPKELDFVSRFKSGELSFERGATNLVEGMHSAHLFTVLSGWAFRYKLLPDGRRQIMNYVLPGDLIGLQGSLMGEMDHSVEALTSVTLCLFERSRLQQLFERHAAGLRSGSPRTRSASSTSICSASGVARRWSAPPICSPSSTSAPIRWGSTAASASFRSSSSMSPIRSACRSSTRTRRCASSPTAS